MRLVDELLQRRGIKPVVISVAVCWDELARIHNLGRGAERSINTSKSVKLVPTKYHRPPVDGKS